MADGAAPIRANASSCDRQARGRLECELRGALRAASGFRTTQQSAAGDLLTVLAPYAERGEKSSARPTGAICVSPALRAVVTSDMGVVISSETALPMLQAWTLNG
jgi:hypothetical protein